MEKSRAKVTGVTGVTRVTGVSEGGEGSEWFPWSSPLELHVRITAGWLDVCPLVDLALSHGATPTSHTHFLRECTQGLGGGILHVYLGRGREKASLTSQPNSFLQEWLALCSLGTSIPISVWAC